MSNNNEYISFDMNKDWFKINKSITLCNPNNPDDKLVFYSVEELLDFNRKIWDFKKQTEWQPIDTAPKDGSWVLGLDAESKESGIIRWSSKDDYIKRSKEQGTANWKYNAHEGWQCYEYDSAYDSPTHWLALPTPPKQ